MRHSCGPRLAFAAAIAFALPGAAAAASRAELLSHLTLPPGFAIEIFAEGLPDARSLALGAQGTLFVGTRRSGDGAVYAVRTGKNGQRGVVTLARGLQMPNGVAFRDGALYVGEVHRILRYDGIEERLDDPPEPVVVAADFPTDRHHGWRYLAFGPDGKLYMPIGAPCNVCDQQGYGLILRMNADGSGRETFAGGIRNSVGLDWDPRTRELWFTDNGRDYLGDDVPSDELNHAPRAGLHFGFPFCHQGDIADPEFGGRGRCAQATPPAHKLGAHVASIGMRFYTGSQFPPEYRNQLFIAEHGSWNRSARVGYRIVRVRIESGRAVAEEPFVTGWNQPETVLGRPVDVVVAPDGALLVSDDMNGLVYRIHYRGT